MLQKADAMHDDELPERNPLVEFALFALIALLMLTDLVADASGDPAGRVHVAIEALIMVAALVGTVRLWSAVLAARTAARDLSDRLEATERDADRWQQEARDALAGLGAAIERQFSSWNLSAAERAVAMLLLRGLSHKDVASQRQTSERTARQQALAVYHKAGVRSRAELSAFFMRGLPLPIAPTGIEPVSPP